jgi:hypothetical protein
VGPAAGGHVQLTTVKRHEMTTCIIRRWPADCISGFVNGRRGTVWAGEDLFEGIG